MVSRAWMAFFLVTAACGSDNELGTDNTPPSGTCAAPLPCPNDAGQADGPDANPNGVIRLVAPMSVSTVTSQRPTLHWVLPVGGDGAHVELCADRACTKSIATFDAMGSQGAPAAALPPGPVFWRATATNGGVAMGGPGSTWEFVVGHRSERVDTSWGATLDVNGDGFADLAVGAMGDGKSVAGQVLVYPGSASGLASAPSQTLTQGLPNYFSEGLESIGDVNGDGFADLAVVGGTTAQDGGVLIYFGGASGLPSVPSVTLGWPGGITPEVAGVGDVDGDGYGDIVVSAQVQLYLFRGSSSGTLASPQIVSVPKGGNPNCSSGGDRRIAGADMNGDGFGDVLVSSQIENGCSGAVYEFLGGKGGLPAVPTATLVNLNMPDTYIWGGALATADVNGDGYADLLVGSVQSPIIGDQGGGKVFVYPGSASGVPTSSSATLSRPGSDTGSVDPGGLFGAIIASGGDVNGDGYEDVLLSDAVANYHGQAYLYSGSATGLAAAPGQTLDQVGTNDLYFGIVVSGLGDVNGDGFGDVATGTSLDGTTSFGGTNVYLGSTMGVPAKPTLPLNDGIKSDRFGSTLAGRL